MVKKTTRVPERHWYKKGSEYRKALMDKAKAERLEREAHGERLKKARPHAAEMDALHELLKNGSA
jgi:hypothetical protein